MPSTKTTAPDYIARLSGLGAELDAASESIRELETDYAKALMANDSSAGSVKSQIDALRLRQSVIKDTISGPASNAALGLAYAAACQERAQFLDDRIAVGKRLLAQRDLIEAKRKEVAALVKAHKVAEKELHALCNDGCGLYSVGKNLRVHQTAWPTLSDDDARAFMQSNTPTLAAYSESEV
jgi:septal ring factor EnvC (AmiA/AmiB activator)